LDPAFAPLTNAYGGKIYFLPIHTDLLVTFFNQDIFDKFGVSAPKDGMTWDQLTTLTRELTRKDGDTQYVGYSPFTTFLLNMNPLSIPMVDPVKLTPTINTDPRWGTLFQQLITGPAGAIGSTNLLPKNSLNAFLDGTQAMVAYIPAVLISAPDKFKSFRFDMVSLPTSKDRPGIGSEPYPVDMGITKMAVNKDDAMEMIKYLLSDEVQGDLAKKGLIPVVKNDQVRQQLGQDSQFKGLNWKAVFYNQAAPLANYGPYFRDVAAIYAKYADTVMNGSNDMNTAFRKAEEDAKKKIEDIRNVLKADVAGGK
jgi:multiple sugar transport system substrate-binding protein